MVAPAKASPFTPLSTLHLTKTVEELNGLMVLDLKAGPFLHPLKDDDHKEEETEARSPEKSRKKYFIFFQLF